MCIRDSSTTVTRNHVTNCLLLFNCNGVKILHTFTGVISVSVLVLYFVKFANTTLASHVTIYDSVANANGPID